MLSYTTGKSLKGYFFSRFFIMVMRKKRNAIAYKTTKRGFSTVQLRKSISRDKAAPRMRTKAIDKMLSFILYFIGVYATNLIKIQSQMMNRNRFQ